jgi:hypothetical protein
LDEVKQGTGRDPDELAQPQHWGRPDAGPDELIGSGSPDAQDLGSGHHVDYGWKPFRASNGHALW